MSRAVPKVLIATFGSLGDLHPFIALAHALKRAGCAPVLGCSISYRAAIEAEGLSFVAVRPDPEDLTRRLGMDLEEIALRMESDEGFLFKGLVFPHLRECYDDVFAATEDVDVIVSHSLSFASKLVAEKCGIPLVNIVLSPLMFFSAYDPPYGSRLFVARDPRGLALVYNRFALWLMGQVLDRWASPLRDFRRELNLPRRRSFDLLTQYSDAAAIIGLYSPLLAPPQPDHTDTMLVAGHSFHDRALSEPELMKPELAGFLAEGPPPLVVTLGSFFVRVHSALYRSCYEAAARLGRRVVALVHEKDVEEARHSAPPGVFVASYVPHSLLFPRACVLVHHGGVGTCGQALRSGVPQLVTPVSTDQPDNAARLERLGVARVLPSRKASAPALMQELDILLTEPRYAVRAREVAAVVSREDGAQTAAARIKEVAMGALT
jgi:UDP:flavonoid glycosyltransferase YjiC (YdhE family)